MNERKCEVEVFSRVTGFYRPVQSWNKGKVCEFGDRNRYNVEEIKNTTKNENCWTTETVTG